MIIHDYIFKRNYCAVFLFSSIARANICKITKSTFAGANRASNRSCSAPSAGAAPSTSRSRSLRRFIRSIRAPVWDAVHVANSMATMQLPHIGSWLCENFRKHHRQPKLVGCGKPASQVREAQPQQIPSLLRARHLSHAEAREGLPTPRQAPQSRTGCPVRGDTPRCRSAYAEQLPHGAHSHNGCDALQDTLRCLRSKAPHENSAKLNLGRCLLHMPYGTCPRGLGGFHFRDYAERTVVFCKKTAIETIIIIQEHIAKVKEYMKHQTPQIFCA